jgi:predicted transposase/invertase (TIGR01784 family)
MFPDKKEFKSDHIILDRDSFEHDLKDFSFTFLELEKFNKTKEQLSTIIERWCYFFKHAARTNEKELTKIIGNDLIIQKAYEELNRFNWKEEELNAYNAEIKKEMDYNAAMDQKYDEGIVEGQKKIVKAMLAEGLDINLITKLTGLTIDEIKKTWKKFL